MAVLLQKFGGSSVSSQTNRTHVISHIKDAMHNHYTPVVVVSAMGRYPKPYATDTLLSLVDFPDTFSSPRELDLLMSSGELISAVVLANELKAEGINATALTGGEAGILTTNDFTRAKIKDIHSNHIFQALDEYEAVVVAGFQGKSDMNKLTTIGRGGSDTTAAALGSALGAEQIDIFTDVDGIMTADPDIVKAAQKLDYATYSELCHLAYQGASIVHPRAVEIAMQADIPMRIAPTYSKSAGTQVSNRTTNADAFERPVTGIAHMKGLTQINVSTKDESWHIQSEVFKAMASADISVDFINISTTGVGYTVSDELADKAMEELSALGFSAEVVKHCAKVSVVGGGMTGLPGIASVIIQTLTDNGIQIFQSADSHTTIWVLVSSDELAEAVNLLHEAFGLGFLIPDSI